MKQIEINRAQVFRPVLWIFMGLMWAVIFWGLDAALLSHCNFGCGIPFYYHLLHFPLIVAGGICLIPIFRGKFLVGAELEHPGFWKYPTEAINGKDVAEMVRHETEGGAFFVFKLSNGLKLCSPDSYCYGDKLEQAILRWAATNRIPFSDVALPI
jgi:hypothetical protein